MSQHRLFFAALGLCLSLNLILNLGSAALAHEPAEPNTSHQEQPATDTEAGTETGTETGDGADAPTVDPNQPPPCRCDIQQDSGHHGPDHHGPDHHGPGQMDGHDTDGHDMEGHEHHQHGNESEYGRAFAEGTPELFSPSVLAPDTLAINYSHQFFFSSLPRGSNPAFWFKYSPLQNFQIDAMATLRTPLELELGLAYQILDEDRGDWLNLTPRLAYNTRGNLVGGEIAANKYIFPELWQVGLDARLLSTGAPDGFARPVAAMGFNTMVRVWKHWHLYGDVVVPFDGEILQKRGVLWTAGIKKRIPHTPHILTVFVGNTQEQSLAGRTISSVDYSTGTLSLADTLRLGFLFSIQIDGVSHMPERLF